MPVLASQVDALTWAYLERRVEAKHAGFSQEGLRTVEITRGGIATPVSPDVESPRPSRGRRPGATCHDRADTSACGSQSHAGENENRRTPMHACHPPNGRERTGPVAVTGSSPPACRTAAHARAALEGAGRPFRGQRGGPDRRATEPRTASIPRPHATRRPSVPSLPFPLSGPGPAQGVCRGGCRAPDHAGTGVVTCWFATQPRVRRKSRTSRPAAISPGRSVISRSCGRCSPS